MRKMRLQALAFAILAVSFLSGVVHADAKANDSYMVPSQYLLGHYSTQKPEDIFKSLQLKPNRTYSDMVDMGTLLYSSGKYLDARDSFEVAARLAKTENELGAALFSKAAAEAYCSLAEARYTVDVAARLQPHNLEIQKLRLALYDTAGDKLGAVVAQDQISRVDPTSVGHEVCDLITGVVVITLGAMLIDAVHDIVLYRLTPPEDRHLYTMSMLTGFHNITSTATNATSVLKLGDLIMKKA